MAAASNDLNIFTDYASQQHELLMTSLKGIEVESCSDFRFTFVTDDSVDQEAVNAFAKGDLEHFQEVISLLA